MKKSIILGAILMSLSLPTLAGPSDKEVGLNFVFGADGYQGVSLFGTYNQVEVHMTGLDDRNDYAFGLGYRVADTEDKGLAGDRHGSTNLILGGAYVGGRNAGFRPYGQLEGEIDLQNNMPSDTGINLNVGVISYGLLMTKHTDAYAYVGISYDSLRDSGEHEGLDLGGGGGAGGDNGDGGSGGNGGDNGDGGSGGNGGDNGDGGSGGGGDNGGGGQNGGGGGNCTNKGGQSPAQPACDNANDNAGFN